jgi:hypothetical protein
MYSELERMGKEVVMAWEKLWKSSYRIAGTKQVFPKCEMNKFALDDHCVMCLLSM